MSKYIDGLTTLVVFIVSIVFVWNEAAALVMADRAGLSFLFGLVSLVIVSQVYKDAKGSSTSRTVFVPSTVADPVVSSEQASLDIKPSESAIIDDSVLLELVTLDQVPAAIETACIVEFPQVKATKKQPTSRAKSASKTPTKSKTAAKSKSNAASTTVKEAEPTKKKTSKADSNSKSTSTQKTTSAKRRTVKKTVEGENTISES